MRAFGFCAAFMLALGMSLSAQHRGVKTRTRTTAAASAKTITLTGCLESGSDASTYVLSNVMPRKAKTDKPSQPQGTTVGTAGAVTTYDLTPKEGVNLSAHIGHRVEVVAVEQAPPKTKAAARGGTSRLTVTFVKHLAPTCTT
jgi:hypothetical protein